MATMASWNTRQYNVNAAVSQQHADITEDQFLELRRPRKITFYRNGDRYYPGKKIRITPHRYLTFNDLLGDLTKSISLPYGVRRIYTPTTGRTITDVEDLQDGQSYVCASFERFRKMKYGSHPKPSWRPIIGKKHTYDSYLYGGYTAFGPKYRAPLSYSYPLTGRFAAAYGQNRPVPSTFGIGHGGPGSYGLTGGRPGIGGIDTRPTANTHSDTSPVKPRIVRVVKGDDSRPRKVVSLLMNKRSVQSFEQLVSDISEALGCPKYKNSRMRKLFTLKGRELQGVADFFRDDDIFVALPNKRQITDEDLQDIIEELFPENPYAKKLRKKKKEKDEKDKHDSGFGDDEEKTKKPKRKNADEDRKKKDEDDRKKREEEERKQREAELAKKEAELKRKEDELKRREAEEKKRRERAKQDEIARREEEQRKKDEEMRKQEEEERRKREKKPLPPPPKKSDKKDGRNKYAAEPRQRVDPGDIMKRYEIGKTIGDGNFAVVKEARLVNTDEEFAMKIIDKSKLRGKEQMLENEIGIMKAVNHPNIVRLFEEYETDENIYLVMEYVKGGDLFDAITESVKFTEHDAAGMVHDLATALGYLHNLNIVHRDIKPENLLVQRDDHGKVTLKLADFGLAMEVTEPIYTVCGTPTYVAPEILAETGYGLEVDMWATGVITYILLCGFPPFRSLDRDQEELFEMIQKGEFEYLSPYWDNISESARDLINHLLVVNRHKRWRSDQILEHPWIQNKGHSGDAPNLQREITMNLEKNFSNRKSGRRQAAEVKG
ncbi:LOW QUALITY PROTEIN: serine/threonine-protein kinase DCLK1-like [Ptychodera flava]|uniref:LOW QUALITY PROTEIN: serine/threonine-protein kinase DCLK1-like n=1 Tax=Ptychodera flava TaxID=63121 RepID=UPI003969FBE3